MSSAPRKRLAIVGAGSSGLISLKEALDRLPDWEVVCLEQSGRTIGCWGNPYPGFVSTSTRYTTQFAGFPRFEATTEPDGGDSRAEFFRDDQYGRYLEQFAEHFSLHPHISLRTRVERIRRGAQGIGWELTQRLLESQATTTQHFDSVIICSGVAARPNPLECDVPCLSLAELHSASGLGHIRNQRIVVIGGGESAVDYARRLARGELNNRVFLSLRSGIRVSPRYHPIRGVPSDFLRNRLMLSIHEDIRNWIGQRFVEARMRHQETFEWLFPHRQRKSPAAVGGPEQRRLRKEWAYRLTKAAKDDLFNMFHNKSDDFLEAVAEGRITIVGPPLDSRFVRCRQFDGQETVEIAPDLVVPAVGYHSTLADLFAEEVRLGDFYLGCCHARDDDLYLVGFARPIIGNIPSISEIQARYVTGLIAGDYARPANLEELHRAEEARRRIRFSKLSTETIYPVEMFPYCDHLARRMRTFPSPREVRSFSLWSRMQLAPASTMHYDYQDPASRRLSRSAPIYMPASLIALLLGLLPLSWLYGACKRILRGE